MKLCLSSVVAAVLAACAAPSPPPATAPSSSNGSGGADLVETALAALIPQLMEAREVPGLAIGLVRDDQLAWQRGFGVADAKTRRPVTAETVFQAASLSKPVFAYAVMKLVDAGKLELDRPLTDYLPGTYEVGPDPRLAQITARHALSHTTGFPNWRTGALTIGAAPGARFSYSGEGFVYLARVVEHITGEPFEAFMQRSVLGPLGMTHSSYGPQRDPNRLALPHGRWGDPEPATPVPRPLNPAAGLYTTVADYARFVIAMRRGTGMSAAARAQMLAPQVQVRDGGPQSLDRPDAKPRGDIAWGLGWGLETTTGGAAFWHWGDNGGTKALVVALAEPRLSVIVFANSVHGLSIVREILAAALGVPQPGLDWLAYESYDAPVRVLARAIHGRGADAALRDYRAGQLARVPEPQLNDLGYQLAGDHRLGDAIAVLAQNVADHPASANAYDSLAEIYERAGAVDDAIANYEQSVARDPHNAHALGALDRLRNKAP